MKELEDDLGVILFERTARKCELTQAGLLFQRDIPGVLQQLEHSYERMTEFAEGRIGSLSIATLGSLSVGVITKVLGEFKVRYPDVPVKLHELRNDMVFDAVAKNQVEIGVAALLERRSDVQFESLFTDRLLLLVPKGHPLEGKPVRWKSLTRYPCVMMSTGPAEYALRANKVYVQPAFVVEHLATAVAMVRHGMGVTVLPSCVLSSLNLEGLRGLPLEGNHSTRNLGAVFRDSAWLSPSAINFLKMLREAQPNRDAGWRKATGLGVP